MSLPLVCPAASEITQPTEGPSVICGVLKIANDGASIDGYTQRAQVSPVISGRRDSASVSLFCAGPGIPGSAASYCSCEIWRAEKKRIEAGRAAGVDGLRDAAHRDRVDPVVED